MKKISSLLPVVCFLLSTMLSAQSLTFQRTLGGDVTFQTFHGQATPDGGFALVGFLAGGGVTRAALVKLDCTGEQEWVKTFGTTSSVQNIAPRVTVMPDSGLVMAVNVGTFNAYNILVVRVDQSGNTVWRKVINQGMGDDGSSAVYPTNDGGVIIAGYTNTYGADNPGSSYRDVYLVKLAADGEIQWTNTYGNPNAYDEASGVIQTNDGGYAVCGRFIDRGAFHAFLLKTDPVGNPEFLQTYGDTLHANWAFAVRQFSDGGYALVGSTTLLKNNFQDWTDNYVLRTNATGDTLWTRAFYGAPDRFENASSVELDQDENILIGVATASWPNLGFVPNKHLVAKFSATGTLQQALLYNPGGSHYPYLTDAPDGGYLLTGFSNFYTPDFGAFVSKTDDLLDPGCNTTDVTSSTTVQPAPFKVRPPGFVQETGGVILDYTTEQNATVIDSVLCQQDPPAPVAEIGTLPEEICLNDRVTFSSIGAGNIKQYTWEIGDTTYSESAPVHVFTRPGPDTIRLSVSDGCMEDLTEIIVNVCDNRFIVPNAFTPDGDSYNDVWRVTFGTDYQLLDLKIYNRWGEEVFSSAETGKFEWDGRFNDEIQPMDMYIYLLNYTYKEEAKVLKGDITLLR